MEIKEKELVMSILVDEVKKHNYNNTADFFLDMKERSYVFNINSDTLRVYLYKNWPHDNIIINFKNNTFELSNFKNIKNNIIFTLNEVIIHERELKLAEILN